jgi:hypothetical protein
MVGDRIDYFITKTRWQKSGEEQVITQFGTMLIGPMREKTRTLVMVDQGRG